VVNTPRGKTSKANDAYIRKSSIIHKVPYVTTVAAALAAVMGIEAFKADTSEVKSLQEYHSDIGS
jgi:carbamoyl-phosphate synthase large subunit